MVRGDDGDVPLHRGIPGKLGGRAHQHHHREERLEIDLCHVRPVGQPARRAEIRVQFPEPAHHPPGDGEDGRTGRMPPRSLRIGPGIRGRKRLHLPFAHPQIPQQGFENPLQIKEIGGGLVDGDVPPGPPPPHHGDPERALLHGPGARRGAEHPAELEHLDVLDAPVRVSRQHIEEPGQERRAQRRLIGDQGVLERDRRDAALRRHLRGFERQRQHLGQPGPGQRLPDARVLQQRRDERPWGRLSARHGQRDPVVSVDPGDFLDEVLLAHEVGPE